MKSGFNLSEVLITLGIIGVVAALTIPPVVSKYKDYVMLTQSKKAYSTVLNGLNMLKFELGANDYSLIFETSTNEEILINLSKHIQMSKICGAKPGCWATKTSTGYDFYNTYGLAKAILKDGSTIAIQSYSNIRTGEGNCWTNFNTGTDANGQPILRKTQQCGQIYIDTNGFKGPNKYGADTFAFLVVPKSISQYLGNLNDALINNALHY